MVEELFRSFLPSTYLMGVASGALLSIIGTLLFQRAFRTWLEQQRAEEHRDRISRVEARLRQAEM